MFGHKKGKSKSLLLLKETVRTALKEIRDARA